MRPLGPIRATGTRQPGSFRCPRAIGAVVLVTAIAAAGCGTGAPDSPRPPPLPGPESEPGLAEPAIRAPEMLPEDVPPANGPLWKAPFSSTPYSAGDMFVGSMNPTPSEPMLTIAGVDPAGVTRWKVQTNPACAGFGITRSGDRLLAVVLFSDADTASGKLATRTTASAFDVHTGQQAWGPVEVSGSLRGPGLTFGESRGERMMLSPRDGRVVAAEGDGVVPHYEHDGTAVLEKRGKLEAVDSGSREPLWSGEAVDVPPAVAAKAAGRPVVPKFSQAAGASEADLVALDWSSSDGQVLGHSLHDLRTGRQVADLGDQNEVTTHVDADTGVVVTEGAGESGLITAIDRRTGAQLWQHPTEQSGLSLTTTAGGVGYGSDDIGSVKIDLRTGMPLSHGTWEVPEAVTSTGHMLVETSAGQDRSAYVAFSDPGRNR